MLLIPGDAMLQRPRFFIVGGSRVQNGFIIDFQNPWQIGVLSGADVHRCIENGKPRIFKRNFRLAAAAMSHDQRRRAFISGKSPDDVPTASRRSKETATAKE